MQILVWTFLYLRDSHVTGNQVPKSSTIDLCVLRKVVLPAPKS